MRTFFSPSRTPSPSRSTYSLSPPPTPARHTFQASMMEESVEIAESVVRKWDNEQGSSSTHSTKYDSLFSRDRRQAAEFLRSVTDLQKSMHFFLTENSSSHMLVRAQSAMQIAMKRLEKEFYEILSKNWNSLDPDSSVSTLSATSSISYFEDGDEIQVAGDSVDSEEERISELAMSDLKAIADAMISSGYGKECVKIYKRIRRSIVDESLYYLGIERLSSSQFQKMDWEVIELKIKFWLNAVKAAVTNLFPRERILCDHVFSSSSSGTIAESCFAEIAREGAMSLFVFPELVARSKKLLSPEKMFRVLDLYDAISELWPEIESIFSFESISTVRSQAITSLDKLREAIRAMLTDFENAIQKETSKSPVPGGGVHPAARYVMNYLVVLSDYSGVVSDIVADWPLLIQSPLPESYYSSLTSDDNASTAISVRLAWIILLLLCKLDGKAHMYNDVAQSYLFLANNLNYVISKVRSSNLRLLMGDDWLVNHEAKVKQYVGNYERIGWSKVISSLPELSPTTDISREEAGECFRRFNSAFEEAHSKQTAWVVTDPKLRDEIKVSLSRKLLPAYQAMYEKYRPIFRRSMGVEPIIRFAPDDLGNYLSDLFYGAGSSRSVSSSSSSAYLTSSPSPPPSRGRRVR